MEILTSLQKAKLLERMTQLRFERSEWLIVEVKIKNNAKTNSSSGDIATIISGLFTDREGYVMPCNPTEVLALIKWGKDNDPQKVALYVRGELKDEACEAHVAPVTTEGIKKISLIIATPTAEDGVYYPQRVVREKNVFMIADDDMYMRSLVRAGLKDIGDIVEVGTGYEVCDAYKQHNPDMLLLDIHLPGMDGQKILEQVGKLDPKAYIIMLSADSSPENVKWTRQHGAKGFLTKPFNKAKLIEYVSGCNTVIAPIQS
jgi:two-component system chemotaxis response regulator CheY